MKKLLLIPVLFLLLLPISFSATIELIYPQNGYTCSGGANMINYDGYWIVQEFYPSENITITGIQFEVYYNSNITNDSFDLPIQVRLYDGLHNQPNTTLLGSQTQIVHIVSDDPTYTLIEHRSNPRFNITANLQANHLYYIYINASYAGMPPNNTAVYSVCGDMAQYIGVYGYLYYQPLDQFVPIGGGGFYLKFRVYYLYNDTYPPNITINSPQNITYNTSNITIDITAVDDINMSEIIYELDGINKTYNGTTVETLQPGQHTLKVYAIDWGNNTAVKELNFTILDINPPTLTIISPESKDYNNSNITININASDDFAIDKILYTIDNNTYTYTNPITIPLTEGLHNLTVFVNDTFGNNVTDSLSFFIDLTKPNITINSPQNNQTYYQQNITFDFSVSDNRNVNLTWFNLDGNNYNYTSPMTLSLSNGNHSLTVYCKDNAGNVQSNSISFTLCYLELLNATNWTSWGSCSGGVQYRYRNATYINYNNTCGLIQTIQEKESRSCGSSGGGGGGGSSVSTKKVSYNFTNITIPKIIIPEKTYDYFYEPKIKKDEEKEINCHKTDKHNIRKLKIKTNKDVNYVSIKIYRVDKKEIEKEINNAKAYIKIEHENLEDDDIDSVKIEFEHENEHVSLYRYHDNEWHRLKTKKIGKTDDGKYIFEAESPGLSYFAIVEEQNIDFELVKENQTNETVNKTSENVKESSNKNKYLILVLGIIGLIIVIGGSGYMIYRNVKKEK